LNSCRSPYSAPRSSQTAWKRSTFRSKRRKPSRPALFTVLPSFASAKSFMGFFLMLCRAPGSQPVSRDMNSTRSISNLSAGKGSACTGGRPSVRSRYRFVAALQETTWKVRP